MAKEMEITMEKSIDIKPEVSENNEKNTSRIEIKNVRAWYEDFEAIKGIDMEIKPNTVTAFIGPSGCGKSTFLRMFNRMNDYVDGFHMEGKIKINGDSIYKKKVNVEELRKEVGMVFQKPNPFPKSIYDNVAYGLKIQGIKDKGFLDKRVEKALKQADLWEEVKNDLKKSALALSGGQQQRLCIARTLAVEPSIILMDEPTSALDPISTAKIEDLIFSLKEKYTVVIVTHNMQQAARVSDYTAFFHQGRLVEYADSDTLFTMPDKKQTEDYITGRYG